MASRKKHIVILATGGTIAGVGEPGKDTATAGQAGKDGTGNDSSAETGMPEDLTEKGTIPGGHVPFVFLTNRAFRSENPGGPVTCQSLHTLP